MRHPLVDGTECNAGIFVLDQLPQAHDGAVQVSVESADGFSLLLSSALTDRYFDVGVAQSPLDR